MAEMLSIIDGIQKQDLGTERVARTDEDHWCHHGHCRAISLKLLKSKRSEQSTVMKLNTIVAMVLMSRFALSFLWFVVEYGQKGYCHGQLDE
jgi:hypothetical protein